jgi:Co/Zn/Cd efflux system component
MEPKRSDVLGAGLLAVVLVVLVALIVLAALPS